MSGPESTRTPSNSGTPEEALCRSAIYYALSLGLHAPSAERLGLLRSEDAARALAEASHFLEAGGELTASLAAWRRTLPSFTLDDWRSAHARIFGHTPRGRVCPYETEYGQEGLFAQPRQLATVMGFYRAFGLETTEAERERADHVSCELEFLDFLARKEAVAGERSDTVSLEETRKAARLFLRDHFARFGRAFGRLLREADTGGYFGSLGDLLYDFLTFECGRLGVEPGPALLPLRPLEEESVPMACGDQSDLVQINVPG